MAALGHHVFLIPTSVAPGGTYQPQRIRIKLVSKNAFYFLTTLYVGLQNLSLPRIQTVLLIANCMAPHMFGTINSVRSSPQDLCLSTFKTASNLNTINVLDDLVLCFQECD